MADSHYANLLVQLTHGVDDPVFVAALIAELRDDARSPLAGRLPGPVELVETLGMDQPEIVAEIRTRTRIAQELFTTDGPTDEVRLLLEQCRELLRAVRAPVVV